MAEPKAASTHENWTSRFSFLMASIGFAVGLGNIWRFPYVVGESGGSAFIFVYLVCAFGIGVPLVMGEWAIGRRSQGAASASGSIRAVATESGVSERWGNVGGMAVIAAFMLMMFYTVVAGWTMDYFVVAARGSFEGIDAVGSKSMFDALLADPLRLAFWHTVVVIVTVRVNARGLHAGIEKAVNFLMPGLFVIVILMVGYAWVVGDMSAAAHFILTPDFSRINGATMLAALGQAFFSIGIAMAVMITFGSHLDRSVSITQNAFIVVGADTLVACLAGFAIFPLVFQYGLAPDAGTGLVFQTLPIAFGQLPGGQVFGSIFFLLLIAAAITSCIGIFAPVVAWVEEQLETSHVRAATIAGIVLWLAGFGTVFSFNWLADFHPLSFIPPLAAQTIYDSTDFIMTRVLLPVGAFLTAMFLGWRVSSNALREELGLADGLGFRLWLWLVRLVVPVAVAAIFVAGITG